MNNIKFSFTPKFSLFFSNTDFRERTKSGNCYATNFMRFCTNPLHENMWGWGSSWPSDRTCALENRLPYLNEILYLSFWYSLTWRPYSWWFTKLRKHINKPKKRKYDNNLSTKSLTHLDHGGGQFQKEHLYQRVGLLKR
jgi:hypothetical protein